VHYGLIMRLMSVPNLQLMTSVLTNPAALPLRSLTDCFPSAMISSPVLVVSPHPDDETLGCGGAIALLHRLGCEINVLVISDGTRSHPNSRKYPAMALRSLRERETIAAMSILGIAADTVTFLGLPDSAVPGADAPEFAVAVSQCQNYLEHHPPKTIFAPWRADPHPDHRATWQLVAAALQTMSQPPRLIEYPIWDWDLTQRGDGSMSTHAGWRLAIEDVVVLKQQAIAAYQSQVTPLIDDDPEGFCLTPEMLTNFHQPWEVYFEEIV
jgi:LmbE family N-acetylglucosaminyl deacetylase